MHRDHATRCYVLALVIADALLLGAAFVGAALLRGTVDILPVQPYFDPQSRVGRNDRFIDRPDSPAGQHKLELVEQLIPMAAEVGANLAQYALAWTLTQAAVTAPIIGPRTMEQLEDNLGALGVQIPAEHLRRIDALVAPATDI